MKTVIFMMKSKTWAQIAAVNVDTLNTHLKMIKKERLKKAKKELIKTEIIFNFWNIITNMKKQVEEIFKKKLTKIVQKHMNCNMKTMKKNIKTIMKTVTFMMKSKMWAQITAVNADTLNIHLKMIKRERLKKTKRKLIKTEIIFNF